MPYFVATYDYTADVDARDAVRPTHRAWLASRAELLLSGPTDADGAVLVVEAPDADAVEKLLDLDPFHVDGRVIGSRSVVGWTPVIGTLVEALRRNS